MHEDKVHYFFYKMSPLFGDAKYAYEVIKQSFSFQKDETRGKAIPFELSERKRLLRWLNKNLEFFSTSLNLYICGKEQNSSGRVQIRPSFANALISYLMEVTAFLVAYDDRHVSMSIKYFNIPLTVFF